MSRSWPVLSVRLAVALAFADASIVVLALPEVVDQLHTTISHAVWVIVVYNVALVTGVVGTILARHRISVRPALLAGLALFGVASLGSGAAGSLKVLLVFRALQGVGGALVLCASLPLLRRQDDPGQGLNGWSAAAALGAATGPALGGVLTQVFDWRAIFYAQAPAAAAAIFAVVRSSVRHVSHDEEEKEGPPAPLAPVAADLALGLLSAALIGALFFIVLMLIDVWLIEPIAAAAIVSVLPLMTYGVERFARERHPVVFGTIGALLLAAGLLVMSRATHKEVGLAIGALVACGAGLGLAFPSLTAAALAGRLPSMVRAGRTAAVRDAGLIAGLLILTPTFVHDLDKAGNTAFPPVLAKLESAPLPTFTRNVLEAKMFVIYKATPQSRLPDFSPAFHDAELISRPSARPTLRSLKTLVQGNVERAATGSFHRSLRDSAIFALLVLPVLALAAGLARRRPGPDA